MPSRFLAVAFCLTSCLVFAGPIQAETFADVVGEVGPQPESRVERFPFEITQADTSLGLSAEVDLTEGTWALRVLNSKGGTLTSMGCSGQLRMSDHRLGFFGEAGEGTVEITTSNAVGTWHVAVSDAPPPAPQAPGPHAFVSSLLMVLVGVASVVWWRVRSRSRWRWFAAGAGIWTVGVALKFLCAYFFYKPVLAMLKESLTHVGYLITGSIYGGLFTGVFEIGVTLCAGLIWRSMAREPKRAVAVGVGAGGFEAAVVGLVSLVWTLVMLSRAQGSEQFTAQMGHMASTTAVFWLVGPVERVITILCHTSSRALVLLSVARRRWAFFWYGFGIMTVIDAIAEAVRLSEALGRYSVWWIEAAIAPFAAASLVAIVWCLRHWPRQTPPGPEQAGV